MKEQILTLRKQNKSYREIAKIVNCSLSTISYYCGKGQKEKKKKQTQIFRKNNTINTKLSAFKARKIYEKTYNFQKREKSKYDPSKENLFTVEEVISKIGDNPICYLTGNKIDLADSKSYSFDHIIPISKGGLNTLENLELITVDINKMKHNLSLEDFLNNCKKILEYNGYQVLKK